jgi:hypothetical protein
MGSENLRALALARYKTALSKATPFVHCKGDDVDAHLFPLWRDAVHDIVRTNGSCPCAGHHPGTCFLTWIPAVQRSYFPEGHDLSYEEFKQMFETGRRLAFQAMKQSPHGTH